MRQPSGAYITAMATFYPVEVDLDGRRHRGEWVLKQGGRLTVGGFYGAKTVDLGDAKPAALAKAVLRDLVQAWQAREQEPPPAPRRRTLEDRPTAVTVQVGGKSWSGGWRLLGGYVFLSSAYGERSAPMKRSTPEHVAERLLKELVASWARQ